MILLLSLLFVFVLASVTAVGYVKYVRPSSVLDRLSETSRLVPSSASGESWRSSFARFLERLGAMMPQSPQEARLARMRLGLAGYRSEHAILLLQGTKILSGAVFGLADLMLRSTLFSSNMVSLVSIVAAPVGGYYLPGMLIDHLGSARSQKIRLALADMLDLLVVCTEAGSGLDQSMIRVSQELKTTHSALSQELAIVNFEMLAGKSREDALRNLATRTREPELGKLIAILIQADRFGTSIAETLRIQSEYLRVRRSQDVQEKAGKVGTKIMIPVFLFCFPAMLVVVAGPGLLMLAKILLPALGSIH